MADLFPLNDILRSSATKSGETDDAEVTKNIYVVNYADDGGFAILAADTLMETILAYSDQGNITDTMDNPGVRMFMEMIPGYAAAQLAHDPGWDSMSMEDKYPAQSEILLRREYTQVGPFIPVRWNQTEPFNEGINWPDMFTCNNTSNGKPVAGCVAIAMLNIMEQIAIRLPSKCQTVGIPVIGTTGAVICMDHGFLPIRTTGGPLPLW